MPGDTGGRMPPRPGAGDRDVDAWIAAGIVLLAAWAGRVVLRRRAARREAEARARARARRNRVPLVSANLRGQSAHKPDIWREQAETGSNEERVA